MSEYLHEQGPEGQGAEFFGSRYPLTRALVVRDQIPVSSRITAYEDARRIIADGGLPRRDPVLLPPQEGTPGKPCRKGAPVEGICMVLGEGARFLVRRGFAEERDQATMLATLEQARALGLTHVTDNVRERPSFICNCCRCCCELMAGVQAGFTDGIAKTPFIAEVDAARCDYCGDCLKTCNVKCIGLAEGRHARQGGALRRGGRGGLSGLRGLHPRVRPGGDPAGPALPLPSAAAHQGRALPAYPVGQGPSHALRDGCLAEALAGFDAAVSLNLRVSKAPQGRPLATRGNALCWRFNLDNLSRGYRPSPQVPASRPGLWPQESRLGLHLLNARDQPVAVAGGPGMLDVPDLVEGLGGGLGLLADQT